MVKLWIQIKEKTERDLTLDETFAYIVSQDYSFPSVRRDQATDYLKSKGVCICDVDVQELDGLAVYKSTIETVRDATPDEIRAYHGLKVYRKGVYNGDCINRLKRESDAILKGKEIIVWVSGEEE